MSSDFFGMPIGAAPVPFMVGELPGPVYRDAAGNVFQVYEQGGNRFARLMESAQRGEHYDPSLDRVAESREAHRPRNVLAGAMEGVTAGITAPGRALRGEPVTYGDVAATALDWTGLGATGTAPANALRAGPIRAYHGSPHDFDQFSMDRIGTGEGAQVYGHGLYFAENPNVARDYRARLGGMTESAEEGAAVALRHAGGDRAAALARAEAGLKSVIADNFDDGGKQVAKWREIVRLLRDPDVDVSKFTEPGRMYEVNINADLDDFLDWDKPLREQPDAMARLREGGFDTRDTSVRPAFYGFKDDDTIRSARDAGIPGIKYLDQGSRGYTVQGFYDGKPANAPRQFSTKAEADAVAEQYRASGLEPRIDDAKTRNFVVFDDNLIEIVRKYGIAAAAPMLGMTQADVEAFMQEHGS